MVRILAYKTVPSTAVTLAEEWIYTVMTMVGEL
jgi:hypothetical protein